MGLFSKETCCFCDKSVGILGRKKMQDKNYICKDCEKNASSFLDVSAFGKEFVENNFEYMKKQDQLYKKEFETLPKDEKDRYAHVETGIIFADSIGMFEVLSPKAKKKNYHELFRYDQIDSYELYTEQSTDPQEPNKYAEIRIKIKLKCGIGLSASGMSEEQKKKAHPFADELKIKLAKDTQSSGAAHEAINHLDRIFMKEETYKSVSQSVKEKFTGTQTQKRQITEGVNDIKNLAGMFSAKMSGDESKLQNAKDNLMKSGMSKLAQAFGECDTKYTDLANQAEIRAWGNN